MKLGGLSPKVPRTCPSEIKHFSCLMNPTRAVPFQLRRETPDIFIEMGKKAKSGALKSSE